MARGYGVTRQQVIDAAVDIVDRGEPLAMNDVATAVGIQQPSIYHHVSGSNEMRLAVGTVAAQRLLECMDAAAAGAYGLGAADDVLAASAGWIGEHGHLMRMLVSVADQLPLVWDELLAPLSATLVEGAAPADVVARAPGMMLACLVGLAFTPNDRGSADLTSMVRGTWSTTVAA